MIFRLILALLLVASWPVVALAQTEAAEESGEEGGEETEATGPQFVRVGPVNVPVLQDGRISQYLMLTVALQVEDAEKAKQVEAYMPLLKDAYLSSLYGVLHSVGGPDLVDVNLVRRKLEEANHRVLPEGLVTNVLIQQIEQRRR